MRLVIPSIDLRFSDHTDELNSVKQVATLLKSYFYNGNTVPVTVATNSGVLKDTVIGMRDEYNWPVDIYEVDVSKIDRELYTFGMESRLTRPEPTVAKLYAFSEVCPDEDAVLIVDSDTLITSAIPFDELPRTGITVFQPAEWSNSMEITNAAMIHCDAERTGKDASWLEQGYASLTGNAKLPADVMSRPWVNSGFTLVTREFREKYMSECLKACGRAEFLYNPSGLDERLMFYLQISGTDASKMFSIDRVHRLNVPSIYVDGIKSDYLSLGMPENGNILGLHFHLGGKPSSFQLSYSGFGVYEKPCRIYGLSYPGTVHTMLSMYGDAQVPLTLLWHYYFSLVSGHVPKPEDEYRHPPETFHRLLEEYSRDYGKWIEHREWWKQ